MSDHPPSDPPSTKGLKNVPVRYYVAALLAATTMCTSITAYLRPNETSARKSFDLLSKALEEEAKSSAQTHDDLVALRGYVEGYVRAHEQAQPITVESAQPPPSHPDAPVPVPKTVLKLAPVLKPPPPPPLGTASPPPRFQAPAYKNVTGGKEDLPVGL